MSNWIIGTTRNNQDNTYGIVAYKENAPYRDRLSEIWAEGASAFDIACALEKLAAELRRKHATKKPHAHD